MQELQVSNVLWRQYHSGKILASRCGQNQQTVYRRVHFRTYLTHHRAQGK